MQLCTGLLYGVLSWSILTMDLLALITHTVAHPIPLALPAVLPADLTEKCTATGPSFILSMSALCHLLQKFAHGAHLLHLACDIVRSSSQPVQGSPQL